MNKVQLVEKIAEKSGLTKADAAKALAAFTDVVVASVVAGEPVTLIGFGSFRSKKRSARTGRNPRTGATIKIAARTLPEFKAGAAFKAAVNAPKKRTRKAKK